MAFTYDPDTDRGRVRLLIGDTQEKPSRNQIFSDSEIDAFLNMESSVNAAAAAAARAVAAQAARARKEVGGRSPAEWSALAKDLQAQDENAPAEEVDTMDHRIGPWGQDHSEYVGDEV